jgi:hypothetical protein
MVARAVCVQRQTVLLTYAGLVVYADVAARRLGMGAVRLGIIQSGSRVIEAARSGVRGGVARAALVPPCASRLTGVTAKIDRIAAGARYLQRRTIGLANTHPHDVESGHDLQVESVHDIGRGDLGDLCVLGAAFIERRVLCRVVWFG